MKRVNESGLPLMNWKSTVLSMTNSSFTMCGRTMVNYSRSFSGMNLIAEEEGLVDVPLVLLGVCSDGELGNAFIL
jgi:hypothetical protein